MTERASILQAGRGWGGVICGPKRPMWLEHTQLESMVPDEAEETGCNSARDFFFSFDFYNFTFLFFFLIFY